MTMQLCFYRVFKICISKREYLELAVLNAFKLKIFDKNKRGNTKFMNLLISQTGIIKSTALVVALVHAT